VEKKIVTVSYWLGLLSSLLALALRALNNFGILTPEVVQQGKTLWYMSFYKAALLFFLIAIATQSYAAAWRKDLEFSSISCSTIGASAASGTPDAPALSNLQWCAACLRIPPK